MKSDKRQTYIMIGIALLVVAGILLYIGLSSPRVYQQTEANVSPVGAAAGETVQASSVQFPLNLNTATVEELVQIEGLGEKRAYAIVEYREVLGSYTKVEQIKDIQGFGDALYNKVAPYLTV